MIKRESTQNEPVTNLTEGMSLLQLIQNVNDQYNVNENEVLDEKARSKKRMKDYEN